MSYANYCQDQAAACARRARLASSPEIVAYCRTLELRWLKLAEQAQDTGGALGHESDPAATLFPLPEKLAPTRLLRISSSNCGAIATLSRFLHSATLPGGLLVCIPNAIKRMGGVS